VILLAVVLTLGICVWRFSTVLGGRGSKAVGDGENVATYGFDLSTCLIPRDRIVAAGMPKDGLPALVNPPTMPARQVDILNDEMRGKFLVSSDRVVGLHLDGVSRAYPVRMLNWHEVVNDTIGNVPVAVTYNPLCDSAVAFNRRVGGETLTFGVSGLLYNSNLLMYDRRPDPADESLWSQLQCRAVAGPSAAAGDSLTVLHTSLVRWADWQVLHPETEVLAPDPALMDRYKREPYGSYYGSDQLRFPVDPLPPADGLPRKTPVVVVGAGGRQRVFSLATIATNADTSGTWRTVVGNVPVRFTVRSDPLTAWVEPEDPGHSVQTVYCFWFAWYATHPGATLE